MNGLPAHTSASHVHAVAPGTARGGGLWELQLLVVVYGHVGAKN